MSQPYDICLPDNKSFNYYALHELSWTSLEIHSISDHHQSFKLYNSSGLLIKESLKEVLVLEFYEMSGGVYNVHQCNLFLCSKILEVRTK